MAQESVIAFGLVVALICASRGAGLALVGLGRANSITIATALSAAVGAPAIYLLSRAYGAAGGAAGEIAAETVGLAVQLVLFHRYSRAAAAVVEVSGSSPPRAPG